MLFAAYFLAFAAVDTLTLPAEALLQVRAVAPLLIALGLITLAVSVALNPWRVDRVSDRFPHILQDTIIVALFAIAATVFQREKVLTTTAVGAVVIGFALQDTLGNLFAGLAIQIEKPFRVGDWVSVGSNADAMVTEITWRATKMRTRSGNFVVVPNSALAKDTVTNYSQPTADTRLELDVGVSYDTPPNEVKAVILDVLRNEPLIAGSHPPEVLVWDFAASSITYRIRVWRTEFTADDRIRDRVRTAIYYAFRRHNIEIPYPIETQLRRDLPPAPPSTDRETIEAAIEAAEIFSALTREQQGELAGLATAVLYGHGEPIVRQGEPGRSMFIVARGEAIVTAEPGRRELARIGEGGFFGEMSLLTGEARTATVTAAADCEAVEITTEAFRKFVLAEPSVLERITSLVATRRDELRRHLQAAAGAAGTGDESPRSLFDRVCRFLRLTPPG